MNFSLKQYFGVSRLFTRSCLLALAWLAVACAAPASGGAKPRPGASGDATCRPLAHIERPTLPPPHQLPPPRRGQVWLSIDVPLSAIEREFEERVPRTLAKEEDRPIGAPGQVSYRVTRGKPKLRATAGRLTMTLPVAIDLSLCKPFGSLCIGYGSCTPAYDVKASWDLTLGANHELPSVHLSQKVTERCSIGIDATDHVTRVVKDQLEAAEERIQSELPPLSPWIDRAIAEMTRPSLLAVGQCVALVPQEILLDGPTTEGGRLTFGIGLSGAMNEVACDAPPHRGRGLPVQRAEGGRGHAGLELRQRISVEALREPLEGALARATTSDLSLQLRDYALVQDGVLLEVELAGTDCGTAWISARWGVVGDQLSLENSRLHASSLEPEQTKRLETALAGGLSTKSAAPAWLDALAIEERTTILGTLLHEHSQLELVVTPPEIEKAHVVTDASGVWITSTMGGELGLKLAHPTAPKP